MQRISPAEDLFTLLPALSNEFWAAVIGAMVGSIVSGAISFILNGQSIRAAKSIKEQERKDENEALAYSVLLKMMRISSDFYRIKEEIDSLEFQYEDGRFTEPWQIFQPTANIPPIATFSDPEFAFVYNLNNSNITNSVLDLARAHESAIQLLEVYKLRAVQLIDIMKPSVNEESHLITIVPERYIENRYRMIELNHMYADLLELIETEYERSRVTFTELADEINRLNTLRKPFRFNFKSQ